MRILLLRTWLTNIGNGFIDKGARVILEKAFPEAEIIESSGYGSITAARRAKGELGNVGMMLNMNDNVSQSKFKDFSERLCSVSDFVDVDFAVLPGCTLYEFALEAYLPILSELDNKNIPIVFLGAGGGDYSEETQNYVRSTLSNIQPDMIISRDEQAYSCYSDIFDSSYNGIDCAFYINEWYNPPDSDSQFVVSSFDRSEEPELDTDHQVVRPHHNPFGKPHEGIVRNSVWRYRNKDFFSSNNIFISDTLEDYLFLYANTEITASDRIHACVPTLSYGNRAIFKYETPRAGLFNRVFKRDIRGDVVQLDDTNINREKQDQVRFLKENAHPDTL